ncbi:MAG: alanine racemase, partial [Bacteroidetes bacterium]
MLFPDIERPTLLLDERKCRANIRRMAQKARPSGVRLRPHFKTHQSARVGAWFREAGVTAATVSSLSMAKYFTDHGWTDLTVAFPFNSREIALADELAGRVSLNLLVVHPETV